MTANPVTRPSVKRFGGVAAAVAMITVATLLVAVPAQAQLMELERFGNTVAGRPSISGTTDGPNGTNTLMDAFALCGGYLSNVEDPNNELVLIGTARSFRTYNKTSGYVGSWFGGGISEDVDGPLATANAAAVYGCTRFNPSNPVIYYVTGSSSIHYVYNEVVYSVPVGAEVTLQDVVVFDNRLYVTSLGRQVFRCSISASNPAPQSCAQLTLNNVGTVPGSSAQERGLTVNARGLFLATSGALVWYTNPATGVHEIVQTDSSVPYVDVRTLTTTATSTTMFAITTTSIYLVTAYANSTWTSVLFAGTGETALCTTNSVYIDGLNPTFCGLYRAYATSEDELYLTASTLSVVRSLTLPPMQVTYTFQRRPFPVGFWQGEDPRSEDIMAALINLMNSQLNGQLGTTGVAVDPNSPTVEPEWWDTEFTINVPQREYDITQTAPAIQDMDFGETLQRLADYYNLTDEDIYTDPNILPTCNLTKMNTIQHDIADLARETLEYPLIYTNPAETLTVNGNPNITRVKLLMPSPFGSAQEGYPYNETTHPLLENANFSESIVEYVRSVYASNPSHVYDLTFSPDSKFPFQRLTPEQLQQVRWLIQDAIARRLRECARNSGQPEDGGQGDAIAGNNSDSDSTNDTPSDLIPGCVPQIGLTNQSYIDTSTDPYRYDTDYTVFIPDTMDYANIQACLDAPGWRDEIGFWIGNNTVEEKPRKCDTGCIVGVAVASAVVACILIVVLVVLLSKRRRLATVVAPGAAGSSPEFASTLNDEDDSMASVENPLARK